MKRSLFVFRRDLRLEDNPAWSAACADGPVVAVLVLESGLLNAAGPARRDMFLGSVAALMNELHQAGGTLHVVGGPATKAIPAAAEATGASSVHYNADPSPFARRRDDRIARALGGAAVRSGQRWADGHD